MRADEAQADGNSTETTLRKLRYVWDLDPQQRRIVDVSQSVAGIRAAPVDLGGSEKISGNAGVSTDGVCLELAMGSPARGDLGGFARTWNRVEANEAPKDEEAFCKFVESLFSGARLR